jgi:hypothetical protein
MKISLNVSEVIIDNVAIQKIAVFGAANHLEALQEAEEWCAENKCRLISKEFENPIRQEEDTSRVFYAKFPSDDDEE